MDPQEYVRMLLAGDSAGRDMPTMRRIPELPSDYQMESRPYRGTEVPEEQFPTPSEDPYYAENLEKFQKEYLATLPRRALENFKYFQQESGKDWPETDSEYDAAFGPGAAGRSMSGDEALYPGGMYPYKEYQPDRAPFAPSQRWRRLYPGEP